MAAPETNAAHRLAEAHLHELARDFGRLPPRRHLAAQASRGQWPFVLTIGAVALAGTALSGWLLGTWVSGALFALLVAASAVVSLLLSFLLAMGALTRASKLLLDSPGHLRRALRGAARRLGAPLDAEVLRLRCGDLTAEVRVADARRDACGNFYGVRVQVRFPVRHPRPFKWEIFPWDRNPDDEHAQFSGRDAFSWGSLPPPLLAALDRPTLQALADVGPHHALGLDENSTRMIRLTESGVLAYVLPPRRAEGEKWITAAIANALLLAAPLSPAAGAAANPS